MIKRQKAKLLDVSLVVPLDKGAFPYDLIAVVYLTAEFLRGIGADFYMVGGARGHHQQLAAEAARLIGTVGGHDGIRRDGANGILPAVGEHRLHAAVGDRLLQHRVAQAQVHQQRPPAAEQDRPEQLDPQQ